MAFTIYRRDGTVAFHSETATSVAQAASERRADLWDADLRFASLRNTNLRNADLRNADLRNADLRGADLRNAGLRGADLWGADLRDADLRDANLILAGIETRGYLWYATHSPGAGMLIQAGCRCFTLAQAHAHWDGKHPGGEAIGTECRARLALLETLAKARGWI